MCEQKDIAKMVAVMSAAYPAWQVNEYTIEVYFQDLRDLPADLLLAAATKARANMNRNMAFAPSTGEIRQAAAEIIKTVHGIPSSFQAWQEVTRAMLEVGSYRTPAFSSPLITAAVNTLGWRNLCLSDNSVADRARFIQAYEQLASREELEMMEPPQVRQYIEVHGGAALASPMMSISSLADRLTSSKLLRSANE